MALPQPLQVMETGDRCRYHVRSESDPRRVYLVDLLEHDGKGSCSCKDWICRCWPHVREGGTQRCKHLDAARAHFLDSILVAMAAAEHEPAAHHHR